MVIQRSLVPFLGLALACAQANNERPIIGILTQPIGGERSRALGGTGADSERRTMIAASYVKFIESAGARVVPVHYDSTDEELGSIFSQINGLLFPGGGADLTNGTLIRRSGQALYNRALAANDAGDVFPLWGTCMGFQFMSLLTAQDDHILCSQCYDSEGVAYPLDFTEPAASTSRLYGAMPPGLKTKLAEENLTANSHHDGIAPSVFVASVGNANLAAFYDVLSTNADGTGRPFVSTIEAKRYPFFATQWHPEKNNFEWGLKLGPAAIPHGRDATAVSQYAADFFVEACRSSTHTFSTPAAEAAALIYNYPAVPDPAGYFSQVYIFERTGNRTPRL